MDHAGVIFRRLRPPRARAAPAPSTRLIETHDADFLWMLGATGPSRRDLILAPGGIDEPQVVQVVRGMAARLRAYHDRGSWMVAAPGAKGEDEVVGLCGYKAVPDFNGVVEIGYAIAESRRRRGHATRAVAAVLDEAAADPMVKTVVAETNTANVISQRVLETNGFAASGRRVDPGEGELILWTREVAAQPPLSG